MINSSCKEKNALKPVSYAQFELFVTETGYVTDAEKFGWSIVQLDAINFIKVDNADWKKPDGINKVYSKNLPVTQVSFNDALAYCKWAHKRLPSYEEYWNFVKTDTRVTVSDNRLPISDVGKVNIAGNVWDITSYEENGSVRLAGGSLFCAEKTCNGTVKDRKLFIDKLTGNIHIGFCIVDI